MNLASHKIVTGQPWPGARIHAQGATFSYSLGDFLLHIETPSMRDATEILEGKGFMALTELPMGGLWFAVFRFDNITFDCPFHAGLLPEEERRPFTSDEGKYLGIPMAVVPDHGGQVAEDHRPAMCHSHHERGVSEVAEGSLGTVGGARGCNEGC